MEERSTGRTGFIAAVFLFAIVGFLIWYFKDLVAYILIAAVLSFIGQPLVKMYNRISIGRFKTPKALSAILTLFSLYILAGIGMLIFVPLIITEANTIASINIAEVVDQMQGVVAWTDWFINEFQLGEPGITSEEYLRSLLKDIINFSQVKGVLNYVISLTGGFFVAFFAISFFSFFFLKDEKLFYNSLMTLIPENHQAGVKKVMVDSKHLLTRYFIGLCIQVILIMTVVTLGMWIIGVENSLLIGFLAGILNVIPYVGPLISAILGTVIGITASLAHGAYAELGPLVLYMLLVFVIVQIIDNIIFQPLIYSNSVNAHPLEIFIVIMMAGSLAGIAGMVLAIPAYTIIRVFAREFLYRFAVVQKLTGTI